MRIETAAESGTRGALQAVWQADRQSTGRNGGDRVRMLRSVGIGIAFMMLLSCQSAPALHPGADWADITLSVTGTGRMGQGSFEERVRAVQQAKQDAAHQLEAHLLALQTDSGKTVLEQAQKGNNMQKVTAYARRAEILSLENKASGVHLRARLFLGDSFKAVLGFLPYKEQTPQPLNPHGAP